MPEFWYQLGPVFRFDISISSSYTALAILVTIADLFNIYWTVIFVAYDCIPYCILQLTTPNGKVWEQLMPCYKEVCILVFIFVMNLVQVYIPDDQLSQQLTQGFRGPYTLSQLITFRKGVEMNSITSTVNSTFGKISSGLVDINSSQIPSTSLLTSRVWRFLTCGGQLRCTCTWPVAPAEVHCLCASHFLIVPAGGFVARDRS